MNIPLMKRIDGTIGTTVARLLPPSPSVAPPTHPKTALLIRPGGIGDAVHLIPTVEALRKHHPNIRVTVLAERRNDGIFRLVEGIETRRYDSPADLASLFSRRFDLVVDTEQWHRLSAVVARLVRAPYRIGFGTNPQRSRLFTASLPYDHDRYEAGLFLELLEPLGIVEELPPPPWFPLPPEAVREAGRLLSPLRGGFVTIFPGASIAERRWGGERFAHVVRSAAALGFETVVVGGGAEKGEGETLAAAGALDLTGRTPLPVTAAVIARSRLLVSGDSGILHLAVALGVPTLSLFGPGRHLKWAPRGERDRVVRHDLPCSPCTTFGTTPPCPHGVRCMGEIAPSEVTSRLCLLLGQVRESP